MTTHEQPDAFEVRRALERLTQEKGVYIAQGDVEVKQAMTRSGRPLYVVVALSQIERAVGNVLASVMTRLTSSGIGIWALRQEEVSQLMLNAKLASHKY